MPNQTHPSYPAPRALIFDMDGLLVDTERLYFAADRLVAAEYGKAVSDQSLWKLMGRKPLESMAVLKEEAGLPATPEEILARREALYFAMLQRDLVPMPGLREILTAFRGRLKLAVATGSPHKFLDCAMNGLGIAAWFDLLQPSDEIKQGKPDPEIYLLAVRKLGLRPQECVVLEDSSNGSRSGKAAGCYTIAIPSAYTRGQDFSMVDHVAADLLAARDHVERLLGSGD